MQISNQLTNGKALKTDQTFLMIQTFLASGDGADAVKKVGATFNFDILQSKGGPVAKNWIVDLKNANGSCKEGKLDTPDATFTMTDDDFADLVAGKLNPQQAFMQGKMKIKGNLAKATKFTPDLFPKATPENIEKYSKFLKPKL